MSDPTSSYGEPVEENADVDDVVGRANEGLADAEAAGRDAVAPAEDAPAPVVEPEPAAPSEPEADAPAAEPAVDAPAAAPVAEAAAAPAEDPWATPEAQSLTVEHPAEPATTEYAPAAGAAVAAYGASDAATIAYEPAITPSEPVLGEAPVYAAPAAVAPQPIFVQAPEAPQPRGNRAAAGAIGVLAALSFGVLYLAAALGFGAIDGAVTGENIVSAITGILATAAFWVPVIVFFLAFWVLGAIINRGRWGAWVIFGLLVGFASYGGHLLGQLFQAPFWTLTPSEGAELVAGQLLAPLAIVALVIGRELTIWFGAWAAARGKRVTELNIEARREYERTLEAGPQLVQQ